MSAIVARRLHVNWFTKKLQVSLQNGGEFRLPVFNKYESVPLEIVICEPSQGAGRGINQFEAVDISPLSLGVAIHNAYDSASPLAYQPLWTKDEDDNVFSAELSLNTAALNTYVGSNATKDAYLEIVVTEGTARSVVYLGAITLANSVTQTGVVTPVPVDEFYTKTQANSEFVRKRNPGEITLVSQSGNYVRVIGVDDNGTEIDQILPA